MDERQLKCFLAITQTESVTAAAVKLDMAQPTLSQTLLRLEEELGSKLFQRTTRGVMLTDSGRVFREHALKILSDIQKAKDEMSIEEDVQQGEVTVGLPSSFSTLIGAALVSELKRTAPGIKLKLMESMSGHIREWLGRGELDIGVLYTVQEMGNLSLQQIAIEELFLVGQYAAFGETGIDGLASTVAELGPATKFPLIIPTVQHSLRRLVDQRLKHAECQVDIHMEIDSLTMIKSLVRHGHGYSLLPHAAISEELELQQLSATRLVRPTFRRGVFVGRNASQLVTRASVKVAETLTHIAWQLIRDGKWLATPVKPPKH